MLGGAFVFTDSGGDLAEFNISRFAFGRVFIAAPLAVRVFWGCASATSGERNKALGL